MTLTLFTRYRPALTLVYSEILVLLLFLCSPALVTSVAPNNGLQQCADSKMEWYTTPTGETPCQTYQRLRRLCNPLYNVGVMNTNTPPDACDDQVADCCCNSVAFALSMLCLTCQQGVVNDIGFDAGKGAYQMYLTGSRSSFCSPNVNQSLPGSVQTAVCKNNINIFSNLYGLFWTDGSWFYVYTSQDVTKSYNANSNVVHGSCSVKDASPATSSPVTSPAATSTPPTTAQPSKSSASTTTSALVASDSSKSGSSASSSSSSLGGSAPSDINTQDGTSSSSSAKSAQSTQSEGASTAQDTSGGGVSLGAIVGASLGSAAGVLFVVLALILCWRRRRERRDLLKPTPITQSPQAYSQGPMRQTEPSSDLTPARRSSILGSSTIMSGRRYEAVDAEDAGSPFEARGYYASSRGSGSGGGSDIGVSRRGSGWRSRGMSPPAYDDLMGSESEYTESSYRTDGQSVANSTSGILVSSGTEKSRSSRLGRPDVPLSVTDEEHLSS